MSDRKNRNRNPAVREIVITAIAATAVLVTALASKLIADATSFPFAVVLVLFLLLFSSAALLLLNFRRKRKRDDGTEALRTEHNNIFEMTRKLANPAVICDKQGAILWYNDAFLSAADSSAKQATRTACSNCKTRSKHRHTLSPRKKNRLCSLLNRSLHTLQWVEHRTWMANTPSSDKYWKASKL